MVADHVDLVPMVTNEPPEVVETCPSLGIIVGTGRGELRHGMVVLGQLDPQIVGVADVQQPPIPLLHRHAAVSECVAEQRDQENFGLESQFDRSSLQSVPALR